jgi:hypothetical protein
MGYCVLSVDYQRLNHEGTYRIALLLTAQKIQGRTY